MENEVFNDFMRGLEQALAHARGEIVLPNHAYEKAWPDCPGGCVHMGPNLECALKEQCWVRLCDTEDCRVGRPSKYMKG